MTTTTMTHHYLKAEWMNDEHGPGILLTQQGDFSEPNTVLMHPWQLRALCEHFGLMEADPQAAKTIATLQRRMLALRDRIDALGDYMTNFSDHKHADLTHELNTVNLLAELAGEWCADFESVEENASDKSHPDATTTNSNAAAALSAQASLI
jgi:hypothetical protein